MTVEVLFFARLRELVGRQCETLSLPDGARVEEALTEVARRFPAIAETLGSCRVAVNEEFANSDALLAPASVLAIIPPVSGG